MKVIMLQSIAENVLKSNREYFILHVIEVNNIREAVERSDVTYKLMREVGENVDLGISSFLAADEKSGKIFNIPAI